MYLLTGLIIGAIYGRNAGEINRRTYEDIQKTWKAICQTKLAFNVMLLGDKIFTAIDDAHNKRVIYTHDLLCTCNRGKCRTPSINTYVRKLKAAA